MKFHRWLAAHAIVLAAAVPGSPVFAQQQYVGPTWSSQSYFDNGAWYIQVSSTDNRWLYCRAPWNAIHTGLSINGGGERQSGNAEINVAPRSSNAVYFTHLGNFVYAISCRER